MRAREDWKHDSKLREGQKRKEGYFLILDCSGVMVESARSHSDHREAEKRQRSWSQQRKFDPEESKVKDDKQINMDQKYGLRGNYYMDIYRRLPKYWWLVSLFNGISTLFKLFNAKVIVLEEQ